MREEAFRVFGFIALGIVIALGLLAVVQMLSVSPLWGEGGAAWVQAIGSIAAIVGAFMVGQQQSRTALAAIHTGDQLAFKRRSDAISAMADAAEQQVSFFLEIFTLNGFNYLLYRIAQIHEPLTDLKNALDAIPLHEVGSFDAVTALIHLKVALKNVHRAIEKVDEYCREKAPNGIEPWQAYDTMIIRMCAEVINLHSRSLKDALREAVEGTVTTIAA